MRKALIGVAVCLLVATAYVGEAQANWGWGGHKHKVPEITLTTAAAGIALLTGGSLVLADKRRKHK